MYLLKTDTWYLERIIMLMAGIFVLAGSILAWVHSSYWFILTICVGLNLVVFAVTGFCPSANILYKIGIKPRLQQGEKK